MHASTETAVPPLSSSPSPIPQLEVLAGTAKPPVVVTQPGRLGRFSAAVANRCPLLAMAYNRCVQDKFAHNLGCLVGYGLGTGMTVAGVMCGLYIAPPLFIMAAIPASMTVSLLGVHIGCCLHHYDQVHSDVENATAPTSDETYLIVPDDVVLHLEGQNKDLETDGTDSDKELVSISLEKN